MMKILFIIFLNILLLILFFMISGNVLISLVMLNLCFINFLRTILIRQDIIFFNNESHYDVNDMYYVVDILTEQPIEIKDVSTKLKFVELNKKTECPICFDFLTDGYKIDCVCKEPYVYHKECITRCLEINCSCPFCRSDV